MKKYFIVLVTISIFIDFGKVQAELIFSGVDTLITYKRFGFDFITEKTCTTTDDTKDCYSHFYFNPFSDPLLHYDIGVPLGHVIKMGMINLDSLKIAPHDSIFQKYLGRGDSIPPDSLFSRVGHSYFIKTGVDSRCQCKYFAKIRILGFRVLDSANRKVEMRFLWHFSPVGSKDLTTSGLDTFNLNTSVIAYTPLALHNTIQKSVFKVIGDRFTVPKECLGNGSYLIVYDLAGKRLGKIDVENQSQIYLSKIRGSKGRVKVVKVERRDGWK